MNERTIVLGFAAEAFYVDEATETVLVSNLAAVVHPTVDTIQEPFQGVEMPDKVRLLIRDAANQVFAT